MTVLDESLLDADDLRPWDVALPAGLTPLGYHLGRGKDALEVALAKGTSRPSADALRKAFKLRQANRAAPVLLVVLYERSGRELAQVCGPLGPDPAIQDGLDPGQSARIAKAALAEPDRHAAIRFLQAALPEVGQDLPGLRNIGMFATHDLRAGIPVREDWDAACAAGAKLLSQSGRQLVEGLGFTVESHGANTSVLRRQGVARAIAVFLDETESPEAGSDRFGSASPVSHALAAADAEGLPYVVLTRGRQIRVHATGRDVGVGRKGRAETLIEANLAVIPEDRAGYLPLIFGADALAPGGTFQEILERSRDYAADLGSRLRERVYECVVPYLSDAIASKRHAKEAPSEEELDALYEQALVLLFRLLFLAYAEDKDLLPYRSSGTYQQNALKTLARDLAERKQEADDGELTFDPNATDLWSRLSQLFRAVDRGNADWGVPVYDGSLFSDDPDVSAAGSALASLELENDEVGPALAALLVDEGDDGVFGPVDFRSLSVRDFGTIYEGLLESSLALAPTDLTLDRDQHYVPASDGDEVKVCEDEIYIHDRSGARKSTGSYFTKPFAVEHLLDHALSPALDEHLERLENLVEAGEEAAARDAFFDFRCADIAMGSGHFLVAAVDHVEARLSSFLARHPIPGVVDELERLRAGAIDALGELGAGVEIEQATLLRRQIARRCIYGVDRNRIAVELARLGLWIHTFVPGLPLGFLDHNLVWGDSLTGIGTLDEAAEALEPENSDARGTLSIFAAHIHKLLEAAEEALARLAQTSDASAKEIAAAREAHMDAQEAARPAKQLLDLACAIRLGRAAPPADVTASIGSHPDLAEAEELAADLQAVHFPVAFPEVFLRDRSGFDCVLGNPPWEKLHVEEHGFWAIRFPGLRALRVSDLNEEIERLREERPDLDQELALEIERADATREILLLGPYPGMGSGHPDLYKAFCWRFWHLIGEGGAIGVVLPRSALAAAGSQAWRETVLADGAFEDVTMLLNRAGWVFDDAEHRYTIALTSIRKGPQYTGIVRMRGPYASSAAMKGEAASPPAEFSATGLASWTSSAAFPLLPSARSAEVFLKLRAHPRFDSHEHPWRARPIQGDLNATTGKKHMVLDPASTDDLWPVYKGASFYLWANDTGEYYAWIEPEHAIEVLEEKRRSGRRSSRSAFSEMPREWLSDLGTLPCRNPRVAFRDVARATDTRTVIAALVPPQVVLNHKAPYLLWATGEARDEAYLLGLLSSRVLDWYARRFVETGLAFNLLGTFPIPCPDPGSDVHARVVDIAGHLAATDERFADWAQQVGVDVGSVETDTEHDNLVCELDAAVAHLYGLDADDTTHIFETFHEGWDYAPRLERVLAHHERLSSAA